MKKEFLAHKSYRAWEERPGSEGMPTPMEDHKNSLHTEEYQYEWAMHSPFTIVYIPFIVHSLPLW